MCDSLIFDAKIRAINKSCMQMGYVKIVIMREKMNE